MSSTRKFVLPVNSKLILGKDEPKLDVENLHCVEIYLYKESRDFGMPSEERDFKKIVIPSYDMQEEFVCYSSAVGVDEKVYGAKIRIPKSRDRILVESTMDFEKCDAVEIVEN